MSPKRCVRIETGARLHFGLLGTKPPFGGLGVMIDQPSTVLECAASDSFTTEIGIQDRATAIAQRLCQIDQQTTLPKVAIRVLQAASPHSGFGSGTQLSLAIADGLCRFVGTKVSRETLACEIADRGKRSAVGVHGFFHGGLIFESSDRRCGKLNPIQRRVELPEDWRVVLLRPVINVPSVSGTRESEHFARLESNPDGCQDGLVEKITQEILPAADTGDFATFARSVGQYNFASGMLFAPTQGGAYNGKVVTELVNQLKSRGHEGIGQSSWGPGVFVWCENDSSARKLARELAEDFTGRDLQIEIAKVKNDGRHIG